MDFGQGILAAVSKSSNASKELADDGKNILFIDHNSFTIFFNSTECRLKLSEKAMDTLSQLNEFDVVEFYADDRFRIVYEDCPDGATLFVTNQCNSNCIMCPCSIPSRRQRDTISVNRLCDYLEYMPTDIRHLVITGGEPTLIRKDMFRILQKIRGHFEDFTHYLFLTNGRAFSSQWYLNQFMENAPQNLYFGIPLYGYSAETHDPITQTPGSFAQTVYGLKGLLSYGCNIELRIVVSKLNLAYMDQLASFIGSELRGINRVNIMATEMMGAAARNRELVWVDYAESFKASKQAIQTLMSAGIDVSLYNFPLCKVEPGYWSLCAKSISSYKIQYYDSCQECEVRELCGGVFRSTLALEKMVLTPVKGRGEVRQHA